MFSRKNEIEYNIDSQLKGVSRIFLQGVSNWGL